MAPFSTIPPPPPSEEAYSFSMVTGSGGGSTTTTPVVTPLFQAEPPTVHIPAPGFRGEEEVLSDLEKSPRASSTTKSTSHRKRPNHHHLHHHSDSGGFDGDVDDEENVVRGEVPGSGTTGAKGGKDDEDSSADDSSYFADPSNLPKPKSGQRQFSYGSTGGGGGGPHQQQQHVRRESNASLSLSDDSDHHNAAAGGGPHHHHHPHMAAMPQQPPPPQRQQHDIISRVPDLYPQQLTRMHSYSSLVSTSSQPDDEEDDHHHRDATRPAATAASSTTNPPYGNTTTANLSPPGGGGGMGNNYNPQLQQPMAGYGPPPPPPAAVLQQQQHAMMTMMMMMTPEQYQVHWMTLQQQQQWVSQQQHHHHPLLQDRAVRNSSSRDSELAYSAESDHHHHQHHHRRHQYAKKHRHPPPAHRTTDNNNDHHHRHEGGGGGTAEAGDDDDDKPAFKVYWQRWIMLMYMSALNLLSDWTCYSVAPIALLTEEAFGDINAEQLVVIFLGANVLATACEPIILSRLGLRRTVLFGALLLMMGSIVKSGGMPPIIQSSLTKGKGEWRVYIGFFLVGLSQPLYQCTPALLSASWFPEAERTMATSVALNANQIGIGFAFIFGTLLVATSDDIPRYFGLLSLMATLTFLGVLLQFDDAPPTPPSDTARVMRGTLDVKLPTVQNILDSVRGKFENRKSSSTTTASAQVRRNSRSSLRKKQQSGSAHRRRGNDRREPPQETAASPSPAPWGDTIGVVAAAPSPMIPGTVGAVAGSDDTDEASRGSGYPAPQHQHPYPPYPGVAAYPPYAMYGQPAQPSYPYYPPYGQPHAPPPPWSDPRAAQAAYPGMYPPPPPDPYYQYYSYQHGMLPPPPHIRGYAPPHDVLPLAGGIDEGAEPVITITPHHCDIEIRDDQIILSTKACLARPGFIHSLVSFTVSGIVINTLSTFMDYLVRLNGAGREYTGIVGGAFQFCIMISSLIVGRVCDNTRAYYSITIGMLVLGAFGLAECGVSLDSDSGSTLRYALVVVAVLVGPLQPVSTELGVDVVYPLSENTVLVIQQLFSNLLSAAFIPCFKAMKDIGAVAIEDGVTERPQYTFSFYLLIVLHAAATVFFATFNGRYLRYEHELDKKAKEERRKQRKEAQAFRLQQQQQATAAHERHHSFGSARSDHLPQITPAPFM